MAQTKDIQHQRRLFGRRLRRWRLEANLTQEALSLETGIDRAFISELETGKKAASFDTIVKLAAALGIHPAALFLRPEEADKLLAIISRPKPGKGAAG